MTENLHDMSVGEAQGYLTQMLETGELTPQQRFSLKMAIQALEVVRVMAPGIRIAISKHKTQ